MVPGHTERAQMERQHIFVVHDDPVFLDLVRLLLQDERYNVTTTNYVPRTFEQIAALGPSLLIVDLRLQDRAGWDLLGRLRAEASTRGIPVVVVSTDPRLLERARAERAGADARSYLALPFDIDELLRTVGTLIGPA